MRPEIEPLQNAYRQWRDELNPERRAAELAEAMKPYAKGQMWAHAPRSARQETQESVLALQRQRAADKMVAVLQAIDEVEPTIRGHVNVAMQPPDPIQSFMARYGRDGLTSGELLQLSTLHDRGLRRAARVHVGGGLGRRRAFNRRTYPIPPDRGSAAGSRPRRSRRSATVDRRREGQRRTKRPLG